MIPTETLALVVAEPRLSPLESIKSLVVDGLGSEHSRRSYSRALSNFLSWYESEAAGEGLCKAVVQRYALLLQERGLAPSTRNVELAAIRRLALEAADNGLLAPDLAAGIQRVKGAKMQGVRTGNWLTLDQAQRLLNAPASTTMKGRRDRALLATLIGCGLRRYEASILTFSHIQMREARWVIVDLVGKGNRVRTVPMPSWTKAAIDQWSLAAGISSGFVFRPLNRRHHHDLTGQMDPGNILDVVERYARRIGVPHVAPHDLRRTFAKLAHKGRAALEQIQLSLGHASIQTTERYLGVEQALTDAPCDHLGLSLEL
jgi:integrase